MNNQKPQRTHIFSRRTFLKLLGIITAGTAINTASHSMIARMQSQTLRKSASRILRPSGQLFKIGVYLEDSDVQDPTGLPEKIATQEFNHRVINQLSLIAYEAPGRWSFSGSDSLVTKARAANQSMVGGLIWGSERSIPDWIKNGSFTRDQLLTIMQDHIEAVMTKYKGVIGSYIVVNEAFRDYGTTDWLYQRLGRDYVRIAFKHARAIDSKAVLIYNHYENHTKDGVNYQITKEDINELKNLGIVDAVGTQLHLYKTRPKKADVIDAMRSYGIPVWVTEFDTFQIPGNANPEQEQASITRDMLEAAMESGVCDSFTVWGLNDSHSFFGPENKTCLFNLDNKPKLNYYAASSILARYVTLTNNVFLPLVMR